MDTQPSKRALSDRAAALACCADYSPQHPHSPKGRIPRWLKLPPTAVPTASQKLIAGAKKEARLISTAPKRSKTIGALSLAFEAKYGAKLNLWRGSSEDILQRAVVEARGGRFDADVFETGATAMESLHRERFAAAGRPAGGRRSGARGDPAAPMNGSHPLQHFCRRL